MHSPIFMRIGLACNGTRNSRNYVIRRIFYSTITKVQPTSIALCLKHYGEKHETPIDNFSIKQLDNYISSEYFINNVLTLLFPKLINL